MTGKSLLTAIVCALCVATVLQAGATKQSDDRAKLDLSKLKVTGPYTHKNLSMYLIHGDSHDSTDYATLTEAMAKRRVTIRETDEETISELLISYTGSDPLFLQEGDRITGGNQDRILVTSLVVPPQSKNIKVPTMCIERDRWSEGTNGKFFESTDNKALAPKSVRSAAKGEKSQGKVWKEVENSKAQYARFFLRRMGGKVYAGSSSLNTELDAPEARKISDTATRSLGGVLKNNLDSLGVAIVMDGRIEEVNIYPGHRLLAKLYPRIVQSYAVDAAVSDVPKKKTVLPKPADIMKFMTTSRDVKTKRTEKVLPGNHLTVSCYKDGHVMFDTEYAHAIVHRQWMSPMKATRN